MQVHFIKSYFREPLHPITVCLIGAGGTGSQILQGLARINAALTKLNHPGIHVICFDDDYVSETNIGRQLFSESDIGQPKARVLISRLNRFYGTTWDCQIAKFDDFHNVKCNVYITCTDTVKSREYVSDFLKNNSEKNSSQDWMYKIMYWFDCGNSNNFGQVWLSSYDKVIKTEANAKLHDTRLMDVFEALGKREEEPNEPSCSMLEALSKQDLYINTIVADSLSALFWKLFRNHYIEWNGVFINLNNGVEIKTVPVRNLSFDKISVERNKISKEKINTQFPLTEKQAFKE